MTEWIVGKIVSEHIDEAKVLHIGVSSRADDFPEYWCRLGTWLSGTSGFLGELREACDIDRLEDSSQLLGKTIAFKAVEFGGELRVTVVMHRFGVPS